MQISVPRFDPTSRKRTLQPDTSFKMSASSESITKGWSVCIPGKIVASCSSSLKPHISSPCCEGEKSIFPRVVNFSFAAASHELTGPWLEPCHLSCPWTKHVLPDSSSKSGKAEHLYKMSHNVILHLPPLFWRFFAHLLRIIGRIAGCVERSKPGWPSWQSTACAAAMPER